MSDYGVAVWFARFDSVHALHYGVQFVLFADEQKNCCGPLFVKSIWIALCVK